MTNKQKRFCEEYLLDLNATQAAIRAGYSEKTAYSTGSENLKKPELQDYIRERLEALKSARTASAEEVMEHLTSVLRGEATSEIVTTVLTGDGTSKVVYLDKHPDEKEKLKAAELLGKRYGLFTDKVNVEGTAKVVILDDLDG